MIWGERYNLEPGKGRELYYKKRVIMQKAYGRLAITYGINRN